MWNFIEEIKHSSFYEIYVWWIFIKFLSSLYVFWFNLFNFTNAGIPASSSFRGFYVSSRHPSQTKEIVKAKSWKWKLRQRIYRGAYVVHHENFIYKTDVVVTLTCINCHLHTIFKSYPKNVLNFFINNKFTAIKTLITEALLELCHSASKKYLADLRSHQKLAKISQVILKHVRKDKSFNHHKSSHDSESTSLPSFSPASSILKWNLL